ncbi:VOC family protein [Microlunatus parietis]|uniref:PhnB protein n=1 Tax=Microlunatus parietis TaxID=682979 RepID=A0A7Y9I9X0_9ACTN|nr:VOC family protein [Microlunatus parietis]NYE72969.1 PhnB protein [Microlunatus parietis]
MTSILNPYLSFDGEAKEAMEFYQRVFGGELTMNTFGEFGAEDVAIKDRIMHAMLKTPSGYTLMGSDLMPGMEHKPGTTVTISLSGDEDALLRGYFDHLSAGGTVGVPLEKQAWGDEYGQCTDQFGIAWMVDIHPKDA